LCEEGFGELVSKSFKIGGSSVTDEEVASTSERSLLLSDSYSHLSTSVHSSGIDSFLMDVPKQKFDKLSKAEKKIMKPKPGERFVEFEKCVDDPSSGLQLEVKGNFVFVKAVQYPAPEHNLHARDRIIALNGKKIEDYSKDMGLITATLESGNPIRLIINPTALR